MAHDVCFFFVVVSERRCRRLGFKRVCVRHSLHTWRRISRLTLRCRIFHLIKKINHLCAVRIVWNNLPLAHVSKIWQILKMLILSAMRRRRLRLCTNPAANIFQLPCCEFCYEFSCKKKKKGMNKKVLFYFQTQTENKIQLLLKYFWQIYLPSQTRVNFCVLAPKVSAPWSPIPCIAGV